MTSLNPSHELIAQVVHAQRVGDQAHLRRLRQLRELDLLDAKVIATRRPSLPRRLGQALARFGVRGAQAKRSAEPA